MPFCPACRAEYLPSVKVCPDCQVDLVPELPIEEVEMVDWDCVYRAPSEVAATMVQGVLQAEGIRAVIRRNVIPGYEVPGSWTQPEWGDVLVPQESVEKARQVVQDYLDGMPYQQEEESAEDS